MKPCVLCVDDDPGILEGYRRTLGRRLEVYLARGPWQGLEKLESGPEFAVVVADMRMPEMNGIEFLQRVKERSPETLRVMLSGDAERETAVNALNVGKVYAFLSKPCAAEELLRVVDEGIRKFQARYEERKLLTDTLRGSVRALGELLRAADPSLFQRSKRIRDLGAALLKARGMSMDWQMESALLLSQAGCLYLPASILRKILAGQALDPAESVRYDSHPAATGSWLGHIPRLEAVVAAIQWQRRGYDGSGAPMHGPVGQALPLASRLLRVLGDLDWYSAGGKLQAQAASWMRAQAGVYDPELLQAALELEPVDARAEISVCDPHDLRPGMTLGEDLKGHTGLVLAASGQVVDLPLLALLQEQAVPASAVLVIGSEQAA